jgi:hypothetical protein
MAISKVTKGVFSGLSNLFNGFLETKINEIIDGVNAGGGEGTAYTDADAVAAVAAKTQIAALTAITTPDGSDQTTTQALANANKAAINAIIAALKA